VRRGERRRARRARGRFQVELEAHVRTRSFNGGS
jgi:hypothetical protein